MIFKKVLLTSDPDGAVLDIYAADKTNGFTRDAMLVIPGGGYHNICSDREGEPIAEAFMPYGFNAFVLHYSVGEGKALFPKPLIEASLAVKYIRDNAEELGIDPERVFAVGFSAGGHLAAALGTMWHIDEIYKAIDMPFGYNKPKAVIPVYPVISSDPGIFHANSFKNICGKLPERADKDCYSLEKWVDDKTVPMFLVHSANDGLVNVQNSLIMAEALSKNKIPFEIHVFRNAGHGMALSNPITCGGKNSPEMEHNAKWLPLAAEWTKLF